MKTNHLTTDELFAVQEKDWVPRYKIIKRFIKEDEINKNFFTPFLQDCSIRFTFISTFGVT